MRDLSRDAEPRINSPRRISRRPPASRSVSRSSQVSSVAALRVADVWPSWRISVQKLHSSFIDGQRGRPIISADPFGFEGLRGCGGPQLGNQTAWPLRPTSFARVKGYQWGNPISQRHDLLDHSTGFRPVRASQGCRPGHLVPRGYLPLKAGFRFSRKASTPSVLSAVENAIAQVLASTDSAASSVRP